VTTLRKARDILEALAGRLPKMAPPEARHTRAALERLAGLEDSPPRPPPENLLEVLRRDLAQLFGAGRGHEATRRQLRLAPWILWSGEPRGETITGLLEAVLAQAGEHRGTLRTLLTSWLLHFDPESPSQARVGRFLADRIAASDEPRFGWARIAQAEVSLFDAKSGPNRLGHAFLTGGPPVDELLARYGFSDPMRATSAYLCHASLAALREWPNVATRKDAAVLLERLLALWTREGRLRFEHERAAFARGLLRPWIDGPPPSEEIRTRVQRALLDRLGDPRVPGARAVGPRSTRRPSPSSNPGSPVPRSRPFSRSSASSPSMDSGAIASASGKPASRRARSRMFGWHSPTRSPMRHESCTIFEAPTQNSRVGSKPITR